MPHVVVYSTAYCPYCTRAKMLLQRKGVAFEEIDVTGDYDTRVELVERTGRRTVPQIFIDGRSIGGYDELQDLDDLGELDALLGVDRAAP